MNLILNFKHLFVFFLYHIASMILSPVCTTKSQIVDYWFIICFVFSLLALLLKVVMEALIQWLDYFVRKYLIFQCILDAFSRTIIADTQSPMKFVKMLIWVFFILITALYIAARGLFCPFFCCWPTVNAYQTPLIIKLMCVGILIQSYYYISKMLAIIRRKKKQYKELSEKKIEYEWFSEHEKLKELSFYRASDGPHIFWLIKYSTSLNKKYH